MKEVTIKSIDFKATIDERILNDWRYMDYLTRSEDMSFTAAERFRALNKAVEMLLGMEGKEEMLEKIADKNDGHVSYGSVLEIIREIGGELGKK